VNFILGSARDILASLSEYFNAVEENFAVEQP